MAKTKKVDGVELPAHCFAYVGDAEDTSTWKLPIEFPGDEEKTKSHIRNALARFDQTEGIPESQKAGVLNKIKEAAKKHGIDVSDSSDGKKSLHEKMPMQYRHFELRAADVDKESRSVSLSFSSEEPVERRGFFGNGYNEVLDHSRDAVRMQRLKNGAPLLRNHDPNQIIGVVENAQIKDSRGLATVRFARSPEGDAALNLVQDNVLRNVSVGYIVHRFQETEGAKGELGELRAVDWEPVEISMVAVPADPSVGVGRTLDGKKLKLPKFPVVIERSISHTEPPKETKPTMSTEVDHNALREAELKRVRNISALCQQTRESAGITPEQEAKWINEGTDERDVRAFIGDAIVKRHKPVKGAPAELVDMNDKEKKNFSLVRAAMSSISRENCFEREVSDEISKKLGRNPSHGGLFVPTGLPTQNLSAQQVEQIRSGLVAGTTTAGGFTIQTDVQPLIEILRNKVVAVRMGARVLGGLRDQLLFPRQNGAGAAVWVAENPGSDVAETDLTFNSFTMSPKTVMATQKYSRQLLAQASLDIEALVRADLVAVIALAIDLAVLNGSGASNQPTGILSQAGLDVVAYGTNGAQPTFSNILQHETDVATANADIGTLGYVTSPGIRGRLKQTAVLSNTIGLPIWTQDQRIEGGLEQGRVNGYPAMASNQIPQNLSKGTSNNCHAIIFGDWSSVLIGEWGAMEVMADPYTLMGQAMIRLIGWALLDTNVRYVSAFSVSKDALP